MSGARTAARPYRASHGPAAGGDSGRALSSPRAGSARRAFPRAALLAVALLAPLGFAGCFGSDAAEAPDEVAPPPVTVNEEVLALARALPLDFVFPAQAALPAARLVVNGSIGPEAAASYEAPGDRGGTSYNVVVQAEDVSSLVPPGQPALLTMQLSWQNRPGEAADLDIFVDVPGTSTAESRAYYDEWTWTLPVETRRVSTVGVAGANHLVGVAASNAKIAPGQSLKYTLEIDIQYAANVLTPGVAYAIDVPEGATGLVFESVKFAGDTHVDSEVVVVGPSDERVAVFDFNDLAVPTESLYVPVTATGEHVLFAPFMTNGFLAVKADVPPAVREARILATEWSEIPLIRDPVAPGIGENVVSNASTPYQEGVSVPFNLDTAFPLSVVPYIKGGNVVAGDVDLRVSSASGPVARYHRALRYDDERGRIGVTDDAHARERWFEAENLERGAYTLSAVVNGSTGEIGVRVLTFAR